MAHMEEFRLNVALWNGKEKYMYIKLTFVGNIVEEKELKCRKWNL